jgi:phosphoribosyl 1,2-cyclic phosphodiesterase
MSLELCILGSGSGGNCSALRAPSGVMLIDAGLGPRTVARRLEGTGVHVRDVRAICLTHLDGDHFSTTWVDTIIRLDARVFCHNRRVNDLIDVVSARYPHDARVETFRERLVTFGRAEFSPLEGVSMHAIRLAHDRDGSHGFVINGFDARVGYATDLGRVTDELIERFAQVELDVLALESNYDPHMQHASPRPYFLKQRIMGGRGHLSNEQAFEAIRAILDSCERARRRLPEHIVLLHRSRQCNCPDLVRRLFTQDPRVARRLTLAEQYHRSEWLRPSDARPARGEQLTLSFG